MILLSNEFKQKLKEYMEGSLSGSDRQEIEEELNKLEIYQEYLNEQLKANDNCLDDKKHSRILKKGKWKARFHNAFTVIAIVIIFIIVCSVITSIYFSTGEPNRAETYRDVVSSTIAITHPNVTLGSSSMNASPFFSTNLEGDLEKRVGGEDIKVGQLDAHFFFNNLRYDAVKLYSNRRFTFIHPNSEIEDIDNRGWDSLEMIHEGTVAEAYVSFDRLYETDEILKKFKNKDITLLWLAVDTGFIEERDRDYTIGFPYRIMWHHDDFTLESREEKEGKFFSKIITESRSAPEVDAYGSGNIRNKNFIKTLKLVNDYKSIAKRIDPFIIDKLGEKINYIEMNGVKIYGMVVTGQSKEILKLKEEEWVKGISIGEVLLWNLY